MIRLIVSGAAGKMGREVIKAIAQQEDMQVVAGVDPTLDVIDQIKVYTDLAQAIRETKPHVVIDFTHPGVVKQNIEVCLAHNIRMVVGTTGLAAQELEELQMRVKDRDWAALIVPNFAIGAVLMMRFAAEAAQFFPNMEIIEYHHEQKKDAPSGTAIKTAEMISQVLKNSPDQQDNDSYEKIMGSRGGQLGNVQIHSVRLPGYVAHQEVICGLSGQSLTIRHDSTDRVCFMPGVVLAVEKIHSLRGVIYGLENIL